VRVICEFDEAAVYVTDAEGFGRLSEGQSVTPIGFPRVDVFEYDERVVAAGRWNDLREWRP